MLNVPVYQHLEIQQLRMRAHPSDVGPDGQVTADAVSSYRRAQLAIHEVRRSVQRFVIIDENNQPVDLWGKSIQGRLPSDPYHLMEDYQKMHLGDFWRVLRNHPSTSPLRSSNFDVEYIPNNTYSFYQDSCKPATLCFPMQSFKNATASDVARSGRRQGKIRHHSRNDIPAS
jgi:hypothetical protein